MNKFFILITYYSLAVTGGFILSLLSVRKLLFLSILSFSSITFANNNPIQVDLNPLDFFGVGREQPQRVTRRYINLLSYANNNILSRTPRAPQYNRSRHFGSWLFSWNTECNTRGLVLKRDSSRDVSFRRGTVCKVNKGRWEPLYTGGRNVVWAADVQVDHVVPLRNAYYSGAHNWTYGKRCQYTNFMKYDQHLLSVRADENLRKGYKAPDEYLPPSSEFRCDYLHHWLAIKAIWKLKYTRAEYEAIKDALITNDCSVNTIKFQQIKLNQLRRDTEEVPRGCYYWGQ